MKTKKAGWHLKKERGSILALKILFFLYKKTNRKILDVLLYPVILYFYLTDKTARKASIEFLEKVRLRRPLLVPKNIYLASFKHFYAFGTMILDTLDAWSNKYRPSDLIWIKKHLVYENLKLGRGGVVLSAHVGCLEIARSVKSKQENLKIVPLMYLKNAQKFRSFLQEINPTSLSNYIPIETINAGVAVNIHSRIESGEFVSLLADRTAPNSPERKVKINLLGEEAFLPEGPFSLVWALDCDVFTMFSNYNLATKSYQITWDKLVLKKSSLRSQKHIEIRDLAQSYADSLEVQILENPFQWFNFFDFWRK